MSHRIYWPLAVIIGALAIGCAENTADIDIIEPAKTKAASTEPAASGYNAPDEAWRTVDPENLLIIDTKYGDIGVELYPEIAPKHVEQIKTLVRQGFYNDVVFHLSLIHISEPTRQEAISYAVFCLKKKK